MNKNEVIEVVRDNKTTLLYSHDTGFTRYAIDLFDDSYLCRLNEVPSFKRGTHDRMATLHGVTLNTLQCRTFG